MLSDVSTHKHTDTHQNAVLVFFIVRTRQDINHSVMQQRGLRPKPCRALCLLMDPCIWEI